MHVPGPCPPNPAPPLLSLPPPPGLLRRGSVSGPTHRATPPRAPPSPPAAWAPNCGAALSARRAPRRLLPPPFPNPRWRLPLCGGWRPRRPQLPDKAVAWAGVRWSPAARGCEASWACEGGDPGTEAAARVQRRECVAGHLVQTRVCAPMAAEAAAGARGRQAPRSHGGAALRVVSGEWEGVGPVLAGLGALDHPVWILLEGSRGKSRLAAPPLSSTTSTNQRLHGS